MRRLAFVVVCVMGLFLFVFSGDGHAAYASYEGTIIQAGPVNADTTGYIMQFKITIIVSGSPKTLTCKAPAGKEKEMLAVALSAISNNKKVSVRVDPALSGTQVVKSMMLIK